MTLNQENRRTPEEHFAAGLSEGIDASLDVVSRRKKHWSDKRARTDFPVGQVETELAWLETWLNSLRRSRGTHADPHAELARRRS